MSSAKYKYSSSGSSTKSPGSSDSQNQPVPKLTREVKSTVVEPVKPTAKSPIKPTVRPAVKSTIKPTAKLAVKPTVKPVVKLAGNSMAKPAVKPTKTTVKPAISPTVKPTVKPTVNRALLIGINYLKTDSELNGCFNDVENVSEFLIKNNYVEKKDIVMMTDKPENKKLSLLYPSKNHIETQFGRLVRFANSNKKKNVNIFIVYSGHGSQINDENNEEVDGDDEVLCPVDYEHKGCITDDYLKKQINKLPENCNVIFLIDACHSGTMVDLKYTYDVKSKKLIEDDKETVTKCQIVMISGCKDNQTSADTQFFNPNKNKDENQGAMIAAFLKNYSHGISSKDLISKIRKMIRDSGEAQYPQLCAGKVLDMRDPFLLSNFK